MSRQRFGITGATDGSAQARLAVSAAVACSWPAGARGDGIGARALLVVTTEPFPPSLWRVVDDALQRAAARARAEPRRRVAGHPGARRRRRARGGHPARGAAPAGARDRGGVSRTRSPRPARPGQRPGGRQRRTERATGAASAGARRPRALEATSGAGEVECRRGVPLNQLLAAANARSEVIVAGARGVDAMERLHLGSGAEGLLTHSPGSVLVVR